MHEADRDGEWLPLLRAEGIVFDRRDDVAPAFVVASVEPSTGDPEKLAVTKAGEAEAWWIDRRTMRPVRVPSGAEAFEAAVMQAADLGDRVQLALGEPVLVRVGMRGDKLVVEGILPLMLRTQFTAQSYRKLAPLMASPGTLAPLAIDAIDRALRLQSTDDDEPRVRRIYGRAYRRMDAHHTPFAEGEGRAKKRALARLARLGRDVMLALDDAREYRSDLLRAIPDQAAGSLEGLHSQDLISVLHNRMALVTRGIGLLERARLSTLSLLPALEAGVGQVPRDALDALAAPARSRRRQAIDRKLVAMAPYCRGMDGEWRVPDRAHAGEWNKLLRTFKLVRVLGMDVRPEPIGTSDATLLDAIKEALAEQQADVETKRRRAARLLVGMTLKGPLGPLAAPALSAQLVLLRRLSLAKASVSEGLSTALLRLRSAALEAGARLCAQGVLDAADDTFYMPLDEIEEALSGELGAYAARVRLRREDDRRFRHFLAPRRIQGRNHAA